MIIIFCIITALYTILMCILYVAYQKVKPFKLTHETATSRFSVIVPFRNETQNLNALLNSIRSIDYPKKLYEVILIDDNSEDASVGTIESYIRKNKITNISIIKNKRHSNSPKKDAIKTAIFNAKYEWIITTDADCVVTPSWLQSFNQFIIAKSPKLIVAPVTYKGSNTALNCFQLHDFLSLQTATVAGFGISNPFLCNGANLCYDKTMFNDLNGFEGNDNIASGDDVFFMAKVFNNNPKDVHYIKSRSAIVYTIPESTLKGLFNQRVRWASKTSAYNNIFSKILAFIVLLMNASLVLCFVSALLGLLSWLFLSIIFVVKFSVDLLFVSRSSSFYRQNTTLTSYPINSLIYPFFVVLVSCFSVFSSYTWKGRSFKK